MATLLLDIGNTRAKWALADDGAMKPGAAIEHGGHPAAALSQAQWPDAAQVVIGAVTGADHEPALARWAQHRYGRAPRFARTRAEHAGLRVAYAEPQRLGVDRWLKMIALWAERRGAFCVADAGTALTFDAVEAGGQHLGGLIAPGLAAMQAAVLGTTRFAAARERLTRYDGALGNDTESCVSEAALTACIGMLERAATAHPDRRAITGGDAAVLLPHLGRWEHRPLLVLEGLRVLTERGDV